MSVRFSKRIIVRIVSFSLAVVVLLFGAGISGYKLMSRYKSAVEYKYQAALNNLADYMSNIKTTLEKGIYANTVAQQQPLFAKLMTMSEGAKSSLAELPVSEEQSVSLQKYFAQVGDYSSYALRKLAKSEELDDSDKEVFSVFYDYACELDMSIGDLASLYGTGEETIGSTITLEGNLEDVGDTVEELTLDSGFREISDGFSDYPTLIYDGPFSDHIEQQTSKLLESADEVTQDEACAAAARFIDCAQSDLTFDGVSSGNLPTYSFSGENCYITVTRYGGMIESYEDYSGSNETKISVSDAVEKAVEFAEKELSCEFSESYYVTNNNICTVNLAYTKDNIVYYSDLVKVSVDMATGEVSGYCATGYIMNHTERETQTPAISEDEAEQSLSEALTAESVKLAVIPSSGNNEVFCYEFTCKSDSDTVLVYINTETALEEQIYIVLQQDNGVLVV